jgi:ATP-dependent protease ClpP protease subunit
MSLVFTTYDTCTGRLRPGYVDAMTGRTVFCDQPRAAAARPAPKSRVRTLYVYRTIENSEHPRPGGITDEEFIAAAQCVLPGERANVLIDSEGGNDGAGKLMAKTLRNLSDAGIPVTTICIGRAFSAAADVFLAGDVRLMVPGSAVMLHGAHVGGDYHAPGLEKLNDETAWYTASRLGFASPTQVHQWMNETSYFDADTCVNGGFATGYCFDLALRTAPRIDLDSVNRPFLAMRDRQ